jgi:hypothetical protein
MRPSPTVPYFVELLVPSAETEQEFLLLAVHAAVKKYRASHPTHTIPPSISDEASSMQVVPPHDLGTSSLLVR